MSEVLGAAAATGGVILGVAPVLQIRLMVARGSSDGVSIAYWWVLVAAMGLWLAYGVSIGSLAIMVANTVAICVGSVVIGVATYFRLRPAGPGSGPDVG